MTDSNTTVPAASVESECVPICIQFGKSTTKKEPTARAAGSFFNSYARQERLPAETIAKGERKYRKIW